MKSIFTFLALVSASLFMAIFAVKEGGNAYQKFIQITVAEKRLAEQRKNFGKAQADLREVKTQTPVAKDPLPLLRDVVADFHFVVANIGGEFFGNAEIQYEKSVEGNVAAAAMRNELGLSYIPVTVKIPYSDYAAMVAVLLDVFAFSPLPITVEEFGISSREARVKVFLYGAEK